MDQLDLAEKHEQMARDIALKKHQSRQTTYSQCFDNGVIVCCDCGEKISKARLKAVLLPRLCVNCQQIEDRHGS